ncbi:MAG: hypothetical protein U0V48_16630 [Anaerolineales bacterium]
MPTQITLSSITLHRRDHGPVRVVLFLVMNVSYHRSEIPLTERQRTIPSSCQ